MKAWVDRITLRIAACAQYGWLFGGDTQMDKRHRVLAPPLHAAKFPVYRDLAGFDFAVLTVGSKSNFSPSYQHAAIAKLLKVVSKHRVSNRTP